MTIVTWLPAFCESLFFDEEELGVDKRGEERGRREERREGRGEERGKRRGEESVGGEEGKCNIPIYI